jgi:hypothetical protein
MDDEFVGTVARQITENMLRRPDAVGGENWFEPIDEMQARDAAMSDLPIPALSDVTSEIVSLSRGTNDEIGKHHGSSKAAAGSEDDLIFLERVQVISSEREIAHDEFNPQEWTIEQVVGWIAYQNELEFRSLGKVDLQPPKYLGVSYTTDFRNVNPDEILKGKLIAGKLVGYSRPKPYLLVTGWTMKFGARRKFDSGATKTSYGYGSPGIQSRPSQCPFSRICRTPRRAGYIRNYVRWRVGESRPTPPSKDPNSVGRQENS